MNSENQYYIKLKSESILCPYCQKTIDMYYINSHLKNKRCKTIQELHRKVDPSGFGSADAKFRLFIYNLKQKILYGEPAIISVKKEEEEVTLLDL